MPLSTPKPLGVNPINNTPISVTTRVSLSAGLLLTLALHPYVLFAGPGLTAKSAVVMDAESGAILYEKAPHAVRYPASTTKIMTALLLIENCEPDEMIRAPYDCQEVTGASLYLEPGERVSAENMLYALMLRSANDAAYAVAKHIGGSVEGFSELMNRRAEELGCKNTSFHNPHGLNDKLHTTTAYDLALIAREAMKHARFREAVSTKRRWITRSINRDDLLLLSKNRFIKEDPQAEGIKTGWTIPAGQCFVGAKSVDGWRLITVVLGSEAWLADTKALFGWAHDTFSRETPLEEGAIVADVPVIGGKSPSVTARLGRSVTIILRRGGFVRKPVVEWAKLKAPVREGDTVGRVKMESVGGHLVEAPIVAVSSVEAQSVFVSLLRNRIFQLAAFLLLVGGLIFFISRYRKRYA